MKQDALLLLLLTIQKRHNKNFIQQCLDAVPVVFVRDQKRKTEFEEFGILLGKNAKKETTFLKCSRWAFFPIGKNAQWPGLDVTTFKSKKEEFLKNYKLSEAERKNVYQNTTARSLSHIWLQERRKRFMASNFDAVCNKLPYALRDGIVKKVLISNFVISNYWHEITEECMKGML